MSILSVVVPTLINLIGGVVALALVLTRSTGRARTVGLTGAVLLLIGMVVPLLRYLVSPLLLENASFAALIGLSLAEGLILLGLQGCGLLLLVRCVLLSQQPAGSLPVQGFGQSGPYDPRADFGAGYGPGPYNQGSYNQGSYNQGPYNQGPSNQGPSNQGPSNQGAYGPGSSGPQPGAPSGAPQYGPPVTPQQAPYGPPQQPGPPGPPPQERPY